MGSPAVPVGDGTPQRIQLRRVAGWRKPEGAIVVARPSKWGNPFRIVPYEEWRHGDFGDVRLIPQRFANGKVNDRAHCDAVRRYRTWVRGTAWATGVGCRPFGLPVALTVPLPFTRTPQTRTTGYCVEFAPPFDMADIQRELRGHDLCCWCPLDRPCHADVLLELANA